MGVVREEKVNVGGKTTIVVVTGWALHIYFGVICRVISLTLGGPHIVHSAGLSPFIWFDLVDNDTEISGWG